MLKQLLSAIKISALALVLSFGLSFVYAWTAPTVLPPDGNTPTPINVGSLLQIKYGDLRLHSLVATSTLSVGTLSSTDTLTVAGTIGATGDICTAVNGKCLSTVTGAGDNLGNHTATQALNMGTNNIVASGADGNYGATTIQGEKNGWGGIQFKNAGGASEGTLMMGPSYSGFYNSADNQWRTYTVETGVGGQLGNTYANNYYSYAAGKWMTDIAAAQFGVAPQTWQDVTSSRASGVTYVNYTPKPIMVAITHTSSLTFTVDGVLVGTDQGANNNTTSLATFIVPVGSSYVAVYPFGVSRWAELRY